LHTSLKNSLSNYTILFAENEKIIRDNLKDIFTFYFKKVYTAHDGEQAFELYQKNKPDLIISDIKMPKVDGIELIKKIRQIDTRTSIVIISAFTDTHLILQSVELSLLKYIVKPITHTKLTEVFKIFLNKQENCSHIKLKDDYLFYPDKCSIKHNDTIVFLSKKESDILTILLNKNSIITYEQIENLVWSDKNMTQNALRVFMKDFRKKLPKNFLKNIPKQGYIIVT
jgi:DNA-binding response OmpR family regulator